MNDSKSSLSDSYDDGHASGLNDDHSSTHSIIDDSVNGDKTNASNGNDVSLKDDDFDESTLSDYPDSFLDSEQRDTTRTAMFARRPARPIIDSSTSSEDDESADDDIVDVSSGEEVSTLMTPRREMTLPQMYSKNMTPKESSIAEESVEIETEKIDTTANIATINLTDDVEKQPCSNNTVSVSTDTYNEQKKRVESLKMDLARLDGLLRTINMPALPDKGVMLKKKYTNLKNTLESAEASLNQMVIQEGDEAASTSKPATWNKLKVMSDCVQPKTFGEKAMATYNTQKTMAMQSLENLHKSLNTCPTEDTFADDPKGLKIELMPHQKQALAWLVWREHQKPSGGILADDMGLGKTLTMISLILDTKNKQLAKDDEEEEENRHPLDSKYSGGTLVICPASLLRQWEAEVNKHCKKYTLDVEIYHGPKRQSKAKILAKHDMVVTTYTICMNEFDKDSPLYRVKWRRIILDEGHQIRNPKSQTAIATCALSAKSRWILTGTPIHNKELDLYSLLKFLRCTPFDDLAVWKRWIGNRAAGGQDRIHTVISSILLRRTKAALQESGSLQSLPERTYELIDVKLQQQEQIVYEKVLIFSRTLFSQYLHQHAEKQADYVALGNYNSKTTNDSQKPYHDAHRKLMKINRVKEVKSHEILVLLLRLRQLCCHPALIVGMLEGGDLPEEYDDQAEEFNILAEMDKLNLNDNETNDNSFSEQDKDKGFREGAKNLLNPNNPIFSKDIESAKLTAVLKVLEKNVLSTNEKAIIVSQWTSLLHLLASYLKKNNIKFAQLDGTVPVAKRMDIVDDINNHRSSTKILLLSLTAGGVGLNLTGANHMLLLDLHWNPQLELQAQDRIYRVGQKKQVHVYKFITLNTIEERVKKLQENKLALANSMLTGSKMQHMKLSLDDLRMLFSM